MVEVSVVIPTYNRLAVLRSCLAALEAQTLNRARFEIIVVDDASTDGTAAELAARSGLAVICQRRTHGRAAARAVGIRAAAGKYVLLLGDDMIARPELLDQHLAAHASERGEHVAVLGYAACEPLPEMTPLMQYMARGWVVPQLPYAEISDPDDVPVGFFYTCNLSLSRPFLLRHALPENDAGDPYADDAELAYRLHRAGMRLVFRKHIIADHRHPTSYRSARRRTRTAAQVALLLSERYPELAGHAQWAAERGGRVTDWMARQVTERLLDPMLEHADRRRWDHPLLARAYDWALRRHRAWGMQLSTSPPRHHDTKKTLRRSC